MPGGAPTGNVNGLKTGRRVKRLVVGELPPEMVMVKREGRRYRQELEDAVLETKGDISLTQAHLIDTASAATIQASVIRWLLRRRLSEMSVGDIRGCVSDITKAKQRRDAAVRALDLDAPPPDPWTTITQTTKQESES